MWKIFHDSPQRRDIYIKICEVDKFTPRYWFYIVSNPLFLGGFRHPDITTYGGGNFLSRMEGFPRRGFNLSRNFVLGLKVSLQANNDVLVLF